MQNIGLVDVESPYIHEFIPIVLKNNPNNIMISPPINYFLLLFFHIPHIAKLHIYFVVQSR